MQRHLEATQHLERVYALLAARSKCECFMCIARVSVRVCAGAFCAHEAGGSVCPSAEADLCAPALKQTCVPQR